MASKEEKECDEILEACEAETMERVSRMLSSFGISSSMKDTTALHLSAKLGLEELVQLLIKNKALIDVRNADGFTPLHVAVKNNREKIVTILLENGADVNARNEDQTPLYMAAELGFPLILEEILKYNPDGNDESNNNAINAAVKGDGLNYREIVMTLLYHGFHIISDDLDLLHSSIKNGHLEVVLDLVKIGIDISALNKQSDFTLLHMAAKNERIAIIQLLINLGCEVNAIDIDGKTPLWYAVDNLNTEIVEMLLINNSDPRDNCASFLHACKKKCFETIDIFVQYGADLNAIDDDGNTALHVTIIPEDEDTISDKDVYATKLNEINGNTELLMAVSPEVDPNYLNNNVSSDVEKFVSFLLNEGASVDVKNKNEKTPLYIAAKHGYTEIVNLLLERKADPNRKCKAGRTALHTAACNGHNDTVVALLRYDADINAKNSEGKTPLDMYIVSDNKTVKMVINSNLFVMNGCETLERHIVKLNVLGRFVSEQNLQKIQDKYEAFKSECEEEVKRLEKEQIGKSGLTFYNFLKSKSEKYLGYCKNLTIINAFNSKCEKNFLIYGRMIRLHFEKGEERNYLLPECRKHFNFLPILPEIVEMVFTYLDNEDLRNFLKALQFDDDKATNENLDADYVDDDYYIDDLEKNLKYVRRFCDRH